MSSKPKKNLIPNPFLGSMGAVGMTGTNTHSAKGSSAAQAVAGAAKSGRVGSAGVDTTINFNGDDILTQVIDEKDLPTEADVGAIMFVNGSCGARIWDGEEWANLGEAIRDMKNRDRDNRRREAVLAARERSGPPE